MGGGAPRRSSSLGRAASLHTAPYRRVAGHFPRGSISEPSESRRGAAESHLNKVNGPVSLHADMMMLSSLVQESVSLSWTVTGVEFKFGKLASCSQCRLQLGGKASSSPRMEQARLPVHGGPLLAATEVALSQGL